MIQEWLIMFMIYSVIGWVWETPFVSIRQKRLINRGFLHGPMIPIYGFASVTIMSSMEFIEPYLPLEKWHMILISIVYIGIVASVWEYVTSYLLEKFFHTRWWDYSEHRYNVNGRIALDYSIGWGIGGYIFWRFINSSILDSVYCLSSEQLRMIMTIFYSIVLVDTYVTIRELISLNQIMNKLSTVSEELATSVVYNIDNINIEIEQRKERFRKSLDEVKEKAEERYDTKRKDMKEIFEKKRNEFSEHVLLLKQRKNMILSERQKQSIEHFNRLLERSKDFARFYNNYPKASSLKFKNMIQVIRYKRNHEK